MALHPLDPGLATPPPPPTPLCFLPTRSRVRRFFCDGGAVNDTQHPCGAVDVYCPEGSGAPTPVAAGEYTRGPSPATRNATAKCPVGSYCAGGALFPCPPGRYGCSDRLATPDCNGPCTAGFVCPEGSTSSQGVPCGGRPSDPTAATYYCPTGSGAPLRVGAGNYSTPATGSSAEAPHQRTGQAVCPPGSYCSAGLRVRVCLYLTFGSVLARSRCAFYLARQPLPARPHAPCPVWVRQSTIQTLCSPTPRLPSPSSPEQLDCPAGRYGDSPGLSSPECSGACTPGFECPPRSVSSRASVCPAGHYCGSSGKQPCPPGRFR